MTVCGFNVPLRDGFDGSVKRAIAYDPDIGLPPRAGSAPAWMQDMRVPNSPFQLL